MDLEEEEEDVGRRDGEKILAHLSSKDGTGIYGFIHLRSNFLITQPPAFIPFNTKRGISSFSM